MAGIDLFFGSTTALWNQSWMAGTRPASLADKDALIASLLERIEVLMARNAALAARVAELETKSGLPTKTPDNSSLRPSKG